MQTLLSALRGGQASVEVELPPVVEIVPSTVPFETVQVDVTVRVPPPGRVHVPVKPVSSSAVSVPSQRVPLANRSCRAVSATVLPPVSRSIRKDCDAAVPLIETMPEPSPWSIVPVSVPLRSGTRGRGDGLRRSLRLRCLLGNGGQPEHDDGGAGRDGEPGGEASRGGGAAEPQDGRAHHQRDGGGVHRQQPGLAAVGATQDAMDRGQ